MILSACCFILPENKPLSDDRVCKPDLTPLLIRDPGIDRRAALYIADVGINVRGRYLRSYTSYGMLGVVTEWANDRFEESPETLAAYCTQ